MVTNSPDKYINSDLNVRLSQVNDKDVAIIVDKEAILQSIYRLLNTEEGKSLFIALMVSTLDNSYRNH